MEGAEAADRNVEMWKIKKLIKSLEAARGYYNITTCRTIKKQITSCINILHHNLISAVQTPVLSPPAPSPAKKTPAPGKKLRLR